MKLEEVKINGKVIPVEWKASPNCSGVLVPEGCVIHYTAGGINSDTWLTNPQAKASAHFIVRRDGSILQLVDTDVKAYHAGSSSWRGKKSCNNFLLGIEIENWGKVKKVGDKFYTYLKDWTYELPSRYPTPVEANGEWWEPFTEEAIESTAALAKWMMETYKITTDDFPGHNDVSPGRKIDPGAAFPRTKFLNLIEEKPIEVVKHEEPKSVDENEETELEIAKAEETTAVLDEKQKIAENRKDPCLLFKKKPSGTAS